MITKVKNITNLKDILIKLISASNFKKKFEEVVGVYFDGEKIFCADLHLIQSDNELLNQWKVEDIVELVLINQLSERSKKILMEFNALDDDIPDQIEEGNLREVIAQKVARICKDKNWNPNAVAFCLKVEDIVIDFNDFSNIPEDKISNAVHYQIATTGNFEIDNYLSAFMKLDNGIWMEGISKNESSKWVQAFKNIGLNLLALTAMPYEVNKVEGLDFSKVNNDFLNGDGLKALFAAKNLVYQTETNFLIEKVSDINGWNFSKIAAVILFVTIFIVGVIFAFDYWKYRTVENALNIEKDKLALLEEDRRKEEFIDRDLEELKDKNQILVNLSKDSFSWRGLLIHLGTLKVKDVWIKEIHIVENNKIGIKGETKDLKLLGEYVDILENDKDIFRGVDKITSKTIDNQNIQLVQFEMVLILNF